MILKFEPAARKWRQHLAEGSNVLRCLTTSKQKCAELLDNGEQRAEESFRWDGGCRHLQGMYIGGVHPIKIGCFENHGIDPAHQSKPRNWPWAYIQVKKMVPGTHQSQWVGFGYPSKMKSWSRASITINELSPGMRPKWGVGPECNQISASQCCLVNTEVQKPRLHTPKLNVMTRRLVPTEDNWTLRQMPTSCCNYRKLSLSHDFSLFSQCIDLERF